MEAIEMRLAPAKRRRASCPSRRAFTSCTPLVDVRPETDGTSEANLWFGCKDWWVLTQWNAVDCDPQR
ncbi:MAG: hypothetical protein ACRDNR_13980, partial [Gaiellaceae bacterium]